MSEQEAADDVPRADVAVIGAGPAGLVLAHLLVASGRRVVVVERQADPTRITQSVMLQPGVLGILRRLAVPGLDDADGGRILGLAEFGTDGRLFQGRYADLDAAPAGYGQLISQGALRGLLLRGLARHPAFTLYVGTEVVDVERLEPGACRLRLGRTDETDPAVAGTVLDTDWIVAADGKASRTRELAGIGADLAEFPHHMFVLQVAGVPDRPRLIRVHRRRDALAVTVPDAAPGTSYVFLHVTAPVSDTDTLPVVARSVVGADDPDMADLLARAPIPDRTMRIVPHTVTADTWRRGGVVLLGDSAHAMHSFGAQGLNVSIQDAVLYGRALCAPGVVGDPTAVDDVERHRRPFITALQRAQHDLGGCFWPDGDGTGESWFAPRFEDLALGQRQARAEWATVPPGAGANGGSSR